MFHRLARVWVVAAALPLAAPGSAVADIGRSTETARLPPAGGGGAGDPAVSLPGILTDSDIARYRRIFALQKRGRWRAADRLIKGLEDRLLMGHVQAQRYLHPTRYRSRFRELAKWLQGYNDLPDARRIHWLAMRRKPHHARSPRRPSTPTAIGGGPVEISKYRYKSKRRRNAAERRRAAAIKRSIRRHVRANRLSLAARVLARREVRRTLDPVEMDILRGRIGAGWFYYGNDRKALAMAGPAARRSGGHAPAARWYAGLAAYRSGRHGEAAVHFEALAGSHRISRWTNAAAAFWAARSNMTAGRPARVTGLLGAAAQYPRTFYGILAARILGLGSGLDWERSTLSQSHVTAMLADKRARRALALIQVGQKTRAERELRAQTMGGDPELIVGLLAVAEQAGLPALALRAAGALASGGGGIHARALYPVPHWKPRGGFVIDRALIYAFMRQESAFRVRAKSRAGARGLMQLMPATAGFMAKRRFRGRARDKLFEPGLNLALGQKYLGYLIQHDQVRGDIFRLAAAYNGGPGNLAKWQRRAARNSLDPLMFIESIPARETRLFIERVLANLWIYRERLGQPAPSLDAIAAGERPVYRGLDAGRVADARN